MINNKDENPLRIYEERYRALLPQEISARTGAPFCGERFLLTLLDVPIQAQWPDYLITGAVGSLDRAAARLLILRYLIGGRDAPSAGRYLSYREMPWGAVYDANFQGRCIRRLAFTFGGRMDAFSKACLALGGTPIPNADAAFEIPFLDRRRLRLLLWCGDDEFPPTAQILFSDDFALAFSAEDMAVVGDLTIGRLLELA